MKEKKKRKMILGEVVSDKMDKTIVVLVSRFVRHPKYGRVSKIKKRFKAHDEKNEAGMGDKVQIAECRPLSKEKRWMLVKVVSKQ